MECSPTMLMSQLVPFGASSCRFSIKMTIAHLHTYTHSFQIPELSVSPTTV